jgi:hypothetical protein
MPQIEKFGYASATTTVTSASGEISRARSAALIPASLPPTATMCMPGYLQYFAARTAYEPLPGPGNGASCPAVGSRPLS